MKMPQSPNRILIVEDDPDLQEILTELLLPLARSLQTVSDGLTAWHILSSGPVAAIVCDLGMPGMNGLELLRKVRTAGITTPFFLLTGYCDVEQRRRAMELGATDFMEKPFSEALVRETVKKALIQA
jgi:CheY-like chemotaxis protein